LEITCLGDELKNAPDAEPNPTYNCLYLQSPVNCARLEIISDVVSEKARSGKIPIPHRKLFLTVC
jgi:hypothetical protein